MRVPTSSWAGPVDEALDRRYPHLVTGCFVEAKRKSRVGEDGGLLARLRADTSIAAISPDPDGLVPGSLRLVADAAVSASTSPALRP